MPDVEIVMAGWDLTRFDVGVPYVAAGNLPLDKLRDLYSQCDAALIVSLTNVSLTPLEVMACGCVVVSTNGPHVEWLLGPHNAVLTPASPDALGDALIATLRDDERRKKLAEAGMEFARQTDWGVEAARMAEAFELMAAR
jgi:glycosyltransferase involved in cell wall biosynthesis